MKTKILILTLPLFLFFNSCDKDVYDPLLSSEGKISSVENESNNVIAEYTYKNGLLVKSWNIESHFTPEEKAEFIYKYDVNDRLIKMSGYQPGIIYMSSLTGALGKDVEATFLYDSENRISEIKTDYDYGKDNSDINFSVTQKYDYSVTDLVQSTISSGKPSADNFPVYHDYFFNDDGNIEKIEVYTFEDGFKVFYSTEEYTYDSQKAPYDVHPGSKSKNNVIRKVVTAYNYDDDGVRSVAYTSTFTYEYTYNSLGYPTSKSETYPNQTVIKEYYHY
ncbi:MAG: hypothetical protein JW798_10015 [Prolixibacteraceae bacterium]|nr:hypothetical protein [Prolixibacteraceae bacterium]